MKIDYDRKTTAWDDTRRWLKAMLDEAKSFLLMLFTLSCIFGLLAYVFSEFFMFLFDSFMASFK